MDLYTVRYGSSDNVCENLSWVEALALVEAHFREGGNEIYVAMERQ